MSQIKPVIQEIREGLQPRGNMDMIRMIGIHSNSSDAFYDGPAIRAAIDEMELVLKRRDLISQGMIDPPNALEKLGMLFLIRASGVQHDGPGSEKAVSPEDTSPCP